MLRKMLIHGRVWTEEWHISLTLGKNHSVCCVENRLHWGKTIIGRQICEEAIEIIQESYDGGLMVAVKFVRSSRILRSSQTAYLSLLHFFTGFCDWCYPKFFSPLLQHQNLPKISWEQESVTAHWVAWWYLGNNSASPLNLFGWKVIRPKFYTNSIWTWHSGITLALQ